MNSIVIHVEMYVVDPSFLTSKNNLRQSEGQSGKKIKNTVLPHQTIQITTFVTLVGTMEAIIKGQNSV